MCYLIAKNDKKNEAQQFAQNKGIHFDEIFSPVVEMSGNFFVDVAHRLGEPRYICVSL